MKAYRVWILAVTLLATLSLSFAQNRELAYIQSLINEVTNNHRVLANKLLDYTYTLEQLNQELDAQGEVKNGKVTVSQVFPASNGKTVSMLLSENGKSLPPDRELKERARANREWLKAQREGAKGDSQDNFIGPLSILSMAEFSNPRVEQRNGREIIVMNFQPREGYKPTKNSERFAAGLGGEIWIDAAEKIVVRVDAKLVKRYKIGGLLDLFASLAPGTSLILENSRLPNGLWTPSLVEFTVVPEKSRLAKLLPTKQVFRMSNYKLFNKNITDLSTGVGKETH